ncbi:YncE family protein [Kitasatospora fiedleri]|uniref:PD40 domain-containing protein n=1 Tax=Kitasatospora fiedleri TaxID=2991545 RepID=UPI000C2CB49D|nr:PD40 domain-containing protein [Kitasatospora fiedleri]
MKWRVLTALAATVLLAAVAVGYTVLRAHPAPAGDRRAVTLDGPGLLLRDTTSGTLALQHPDGTRSGTDLHCARVYAASGTGVCLRESPGSYQLTVLDRNLDQLRSIPLNGTPSRARVSPSGRMVAWTVFVAGDSYNGGRFSTRSGILDTRTGTLVGTLESFTEEGRPLPADANVWGVTFTTDDNTFYATLSAGGHRSLVRGDFARRDLQVLKDNVECPSLSPDGTRIAYKKMLPDQTWRLTVLLLADGTETPLAETRSVDDQAAWLDGTTVAYGLPHDHGTGADTWTVPADGSGTPRLLARDAESPAQLR